MFVVTVNVLTIVSSNENEHKVGVGCVIRKRKEVERRPGIYVGLDGSFGKMRGSDGIYG